MRGREILKSLIKVFALGTLWTVIAFIIGILVDKFIIVFNLQESIFLLGLNYIIIGTTMIFGEGKSNYNIVLGGDMDIIEPSFGREYAEFLDGKRKGKYNNVGVNASALGIILGGAVCIIFSIIL